MADSVLPTATATFAVSPSLAGTTINWEAPTSIDADVDIGLGFTVTTNCTPNTVEPFVNTTPVSGTATTTVTTAPADPWQAFIDFIVGVIRFIVCLFTGVC